MADCPAAFGLGTKVDASLSDNQLKTRARMRDHITATHQEISLCAYCIWEQEGRPEGRALDHWLQAELQLVLSSIWRGQDQRNVRARPAVRVPSIRLSAPEMRRNNRLSQTSVVLAGDDSQT